MTEHVKPSPLGSTRTLSQQVVALLRDRIATGALSSGDALTEVDLAEELQVSRSTIREAFTTLRIQGLLDPTTHKQNKIVSFSARDSDEISEIYATFEARACLRAPVPFSTAELGELGRIAGEMRTLSLPADVNAFIELDRAFHRIIVDHGGNHRMSAAWESLTGQLSIVIHESANRRARDGEQLYRRHQDLVAHAAGGDLAALADALFDHYLAFENHAPTP